ncbi:hypothetical protein LUZ60_003616 [Juncus effusus]|nr:hypothetical protein LUZ60_003616 [Juncus effusus]
MRLAAVMRALIPCLRVASALLRSSVLAGAGEKPLLRSSPLCFFHKDEIRKLIPLFGSEIRCLSSTVEMQQEEYERDNLVDDREASEKQLSLNLALSQLACDFDKESRLSLNRFFSTRYTSVVPTGSIKLDIALGIGGLPKGRIVEIFGKEASGKTTLALHVISEAQKAGGYCAYIDVENAFNPCFAEDIGVNSEKLLITHPDCAENSLSIVNTLINSGSVDVIVVDSVAALVPQAEIDCILDLKSEKVQSQLMNKALRKIQTSLSSHSKSLVILVNQVRAKLKGNMFPSGEVTCGGNAVEFYAAIRLRISRKGLMQTDDDKIKGIRIAVQVVKNKLSPAMKKADLEIGFGTGIRREAELLEMGSSYGIIMREGNEGSGYWINGEYFKDKAGAESYLVQNSSVTDELVRTLRSELFEKTPQDS